MDKSTVGIAPEVTANRARRKELLLWKQKRKSVKCVFTVAFGYLRFCPALLHLLDGSCETREKNWFRDWNVVGGQEQLHLRLERGQTGH